MTNPLYPAFFRLDRLQLLVVGAGQVGEEKLRFILKSSPNARVTVVAPWMGEELRAALDKYGRGAASFGVGAAGVWSTSSGGRVVWYDREFQKEDVLQADLIVAATDIPRGQPSRVRGGKSCTAGVQHRRYARAL